MEKKELEKVSVGNPRFTPWGDRKASRHHGSYKNSAKVFNGEERRIFRGVFRREGGGCKTTLAKRSETGSARKWRQAVFRGAGRGGKTEPRNLRGGEEGFDILFGGARKEETEEFATTPGFQDLGGD